MSPSRRAHTVSVSFCVTESVGRQPVVHFQVISMCESGRASGGAGREREKRRRRRRATTRLSSSEPPTRNTRTHVSCRFACIRQAQCTATCIMLPPCELHNRSALHNVPSSSSSTSSPWQLTHNGAPLATEFTVQLLLAAGEL